MEKKSVKIEGDSLLIFGGVYSNLDALKTLQVWANTNGFTENQIICTGDVAAYCAEPKESVELIADWGIHCIAGNVEIQLRNGEDDCGCNFNEESSCDMYSRQWYPFVQEQISEKNINWMKTLPETLLVEFGGKKWGVVHGSASETSRFVYKSTPWEEKVSEFELFEVDRMIGGHCGIPFLDAREGKVWLNSGALGMPANDGTPRVWFTTIKKKENDFEIQFHALDYDYLLQQTKMVELNLPKVYANTLQTGLWDSTEVLRSEEVALTGKRIDLKGKIFKV